MRKLIIISFLAIVVFSGCSTVPKAGQGIMVGEVTDSSALVQMRLTRTDQLVRAKVAGPGGFAKDVPGMAGVVRFTIQVGWRIDGGLVNPIFTTKDVKAEARNDFIARAEFQNLQPGRPYTVMTQFAETEEGLRDSMRIGPIAEFKTHPGKAKAESVNFVVVTGMNYAKFHGDGRIDMKTHRLHNNTKLPKPYTGPDKHLGYPALVSILKLQP